jgi:pimeloyl-ACP methyl ester carboxylesterase
MIKNINGKYINIEANYLYIEEKGKDFPVILVHLAGFDGRIYHDASEYFPEKYKLIIVDLPGHGKSDPWELQLKGYSNASVSFYSDIILKLADALNLEKFVVVGTSIGGNITLDIAIKANKKLIAGIAINCAGRTRTFSEEDIKNANPSDPLRTLFFAGPNATKRLIEKLTWIRSMTRAEIFRWDLAAWNNFDVMDKLQLIESPMLLVRGEFDPIVTQEMMRETANRIRNSEFKELQGVGHYVPAEAPEIFAKIVTEYLDKVRL